MQDAKAAEVSEGRLRRADLDAPFSGIRTRRVAMEPHSRDERDAENNRDRPDAFERQAAERRVQARRYAPRLRAGQFLSHETVVALLGGPLPLETLDGVIVDGTTLPATTSAGNGGPATDDRMWERIRWHA